MSFKPYIDPFGRPFLTERDGRSLVFDYIAGQMFLTDREEDGRPAPHGALSVKGRCPVTRLRVQQTLLGCLWEECRAYPIRLS
jgi:hypothetical protein